MTRYLKESVNSILDFIREKLESNGFTIINYRADQVWRFAFWLAKVMVIILLVLYSLITMKVPQCRKWFSYPKE